MPKKITFAAFVDRARELHGQSYIYTESSYHKATAHTTIICPKHGAFDQLPSMHLSGQRCPECAGNKPLTREKFIARAIEIHGERYGYELIPDLPRTNANIQISCKIHGLFLQITKHHLDGQGCTKCGAALRGGQSRMTTSKFIEKAKANYKGQFSYEFVNLCNGLSEEITLHCLKHGFFTTTAVAHLRGRGCLMCGQVVGHTSESFIVRAKEVHGEKYGYEFVNYLSAHKPVDIICPVHGQFSQPPVRHLAGSGCVKCAMAVSIAGRRLTLEVFVERSKKVWGDTFDYQLVKKIESHTPVPIICLKHGVFNQSPFVHMKGHNHPKCANELVGAKISNVVRTTNEEFLEKARVVHGERYSCLNAQ